MADLYTTDVQALGLYGQVIGQWNRYTGHVLTNIGGVFETRKTYDQPGPVYHEVPEELPSFFRGQLTTLQREIRSALNRTQHRATRLHWQDALVRIDEILDPE